MRIDMSFWNKDGSYTFGIAISVDHTMRKYGWKAKVIKEPCINECITYGGDIYVDDLHLPRSLELAKDHSIHPKIIDVDKFIEMFLKTVENSIIYTGAGFSANAGIWDLKTIREKLYLDSIDQFLRMINTQEEKILLTIKQFSHQLYETQPTMAYSILGKLQNKYHITIATENRDILHQKAGHKVITREILKFFPKQLIDKYLTVIGLSEDHSDFIRLYRSFNKEMPILVINNGEIPPYCSSSDYVCPVDHKVFFSRINQLLFD